MRNATVLIVSGGCDIFPLLSYQFVKIDMQGTRWVYRDSVDSVPPEYQTIEVEHPSQTIICPECDNGFHPRAPFMRDLCLRCYERLNHINRDEYKAAVKAEHIALNLIRAIELKDTGFFTNM